MGGINSKEMIEFFRILRLAVVRLPPGTASAPAASSMAPAQRVLPVVYRSFAPQLLLVESEEAAESEAGAGGRRRRRPESMKETFARVIVELINTGRRYCTNSSAQSNLEIGSTFVLA